MCKQYLITILITTKDLAHDSTSNISDTMYVHVSTCIYVHTGYTYVLYIIRTFEILYDIIDSHNYTCIHVCHMSQHAILKV